MNKLVNLILVFPLFLSSCASTPKPSLIEKVKASCPEIQSWEQEKACVQDLYEVGNSGKGSTNRLKELCDLKIWKACNLYGYRFQVSMNSFWVDHFLPNPLPSWSVEKTPPKELIEYVDFLARERGQTTHAEAVPVDTKMEIGTARVVTKLKADLNQFVKDRLIAIFVLKNIGSSAVSFPVVDWKDKTTKYIIVFNYDWIKLKANDWATQKERSPFSLKDGITLTLEKSADNTSQNTLEFLLLHELGHIIGHIKGWMPLGTWYFSLHEDTNPPEYYTKFYSDWEKDPRMLAWNDFREKHPIQFYREDKQRTSPKDIIDAYNILERSEFPTLYSTTDVGDDMADSFAAYYHSVILKKAYVLKVDFGGKLKLTIKSCWNESRCSKRRKFFDELFASKVKN